MADPDGNPVRIFLWVVPRTISTALTKCLSAIHGMEIWFERFTHTSFVRQQYELASGEEMPMEYEGNEEKVQQATELFERFTGSKMVAERMVYGNLQKEFEASTSKYMFAKEGYFVFPDGKSRQYLPAGFKHVFLIRDPYRVLSSYREAMYAHLTNTGNRTGDALDEKAFDIGKDDPLMNANEFFSGVHEVWKYIRDTVDPDPIVIDSDDLLANPADVLSRFCHLTGLPYSDSLLQWNSSPDVIKTWKASTDDLLKMAVAFYETAIYSGEFLPPKPAVPHEKLAPDVRRIAAASMPYFEEMNKFKI